MDGSLLALEKAAEFHYPVHHRKSSDHKVFFDVPSQPAGKLATQRLLRSGVIQPKLSISQSVDPYEQKPIVSLITSCVCLSQRFCGGVWLVKQG